MHVWRRIDRKLKLMRAILGEIYMSRRGDGAKPRTYEGCRDLPFQVMRELPCCFVLSTGRCGTKLLTHLLLLAPQLDVYHIPTPELEFLSRLAFAEGLRELDAYSKAVMAARYNLWESSFLRRHGYVETSNRITFFAPHLYRILPHSKFVQVVRHPADFARSAMRREYYNGNPSDIGRIEPAPGSDVPWNTMERLEKVGWLWNATNEFIEQFKATCTPDRFLFVKAEDLFRDVATVRQVHRFIGAREVPSDSRIQHGLRRKVNEGQSGSFPRYPEWTPAMKQAFIRQVPLAARYGYEL